MSLKTQSPPALTSCQNCGAELAADADHCLSCGHVRSTHWTQITLAVTILLIVVAFAFTRSFVNLHRATELSLARRWFTRGEQAMQMHLAGSAAEDYRTAL